MERKIGEVFKFKGVRLQAIETPAYMRCKNCYFQYTLCPLHCIPSSRHDKKM